MAVNDRFIAATPERVFEVLSDPGSYGHWVVGSRKIRDSDPGFPAKGTKIHHQVGVPPLLINDNTEVLEVDPPRLLVLQARARPAGVARVEMRMKPSGDGTHVTMREVAGNLPSRLVMNPLTDPLIKARNVESLRRLAELAEGEKSA